MLDVNIDSFTYLGSRVPAIVDLRYRFQPGYIYLVAASNGAGKSTLALALCGAIPHLIHGDLQGTIEFNSQSLTADCVSKIAAYVPQDPLLYFVCHRYGDERSLVRNLGSVKGEAECLDALLPDIDEALPVHCLSGGEQQRLAVASALSCDRPVILLDEPFEFLDEQSREVVVKLMCIKASQGSTIILFDSSSNLPQGFTPDEVVTLPTRKEQSECKAFKQISPFPISDQRNSQGTVLEAKSISFSYGTARGPLFRDLSISLPSAQAVGLVGPNGSGKTTLQLLLAGLLRPFNGQIFLEGERASRQKLRKTAKMVFQNPDKQLFATTVEEELLFGIRNQRFTQKQAIEKITSAESLLPFCLDRDPFSLSYGQKKFLAFVCAYLLEPKVLLLDEPTASLDSLHRERLVNLLVAFLDRGGAALISSHDRGFVQKICQCLFDMDSI